MSLVLVNQPQRKAVPVPAAACGMGTVRMQQSLLRLAFVIVFGRLLCCGLQSKAFYWVLGFDMEKQGES